MPKDDFHNGFTLKKRIDNLEGLTPDAINPAHYKAYPHEVIDFTECLNFNRGNAVKYIARAGLKNPATEIEDLEKAAWYIARELKRLGGAK
jgi:hypothetical protein